VTGLRRHVSQNSSIANLMAMELFLCARPHCENSRLRRLCGRAVSQSAKYFAGRFMPLLNRVVTSTKNAGIELNTGECGIASAFCIPLLKEIPHRQSQWHTSI
jgi:hypothetical protein